MEDSKRKLTVGIIRQTGKIEIKEIEADLKPMQDIVGGLIEIVRDVAPDTDMVVDEEGLFKDYAVNPFASLIAGQTIVGDVFLTGKPDSEGESTNISSKVASFLMQMQNDTNPTTVYYV